MRPNIFNWAPSELSQDAFICWLLSWADIQYQTINPELHQTAQHFIVQLTQGKLGGIKQVLVERQHFNIDILCKINNDYVLLIEDKTNSSDHSDQLRRYLAHLLTTYTRDKIFPIYLKTGQQSNFGTVKSAGYSLFLREDFIEVLEFGINTGITNNIFNDFYNYLLEIDKAIKSFATLPVAEWNWSSWMGFYSLLQKELGQGDWGYVHQRNGGFLGFWWDFHTYTHGNITYKYYLQLEHAKFCFKVSPIDTKHKEQSRDHFRPLLMSKAQQSGIKIRRNGRIGKHMTVAALSDDYIKTDDKGMLDVAATKKSIEKIQDMFSKIKL